MGVDAGWMGGWEGVLGEGELHNIVQNQIAMCIRSHTASWDSFKRTAKAQFRLRIRAVWSGTSLSAYGFMIFFFRLVRFMYWDTTYMYIGSSLHGNVNVGLPYVSNRPQHDKMVLMTLKAKVKVNLRTCAVCQNLFHSILAIQYLFNCSVCEQKRLWSTYEPGCAVWSGPSSPARMISKNRRGCLWKQKKKNKEKKKKKKTPHKRTKFGDSVFMKSLYLQQWSLQCCIRLLTPS